MGLPNAKLKIVLQLFSGRTILNRTRTEEEKAGLEEWRRRVGTGVADYIMHEAAQIGRETHQLNEDYLNNIESDGKFRLLSRAHHENFLPYLHRINYIRGTELILYSDVMRLAGTADCIAEYDGILSVIDYKTKRSSQEIEWIRDYLLQAAAYGMMYEELTGIPIHQCVILVSSEQDTMQEFRAGTRDNREEFLRRLKAYRQD